jgi:rhamnose utilization protein RhaD (predicted bifunctional aldolase and dehydrogenase)
MKEKIENKYGKVVFEFPILHSGWDLDSIGYVVDNNGSKILILTNHGVDYMADPYELETKIAEYQKTIMQTQKALTLLKTIL